MKFCRISEKFNKILHPLTSKIPSIHTKAAAIKATKSKRFP